MTAADIDLTLARREAEGRFTETFKVFRVTRVLGETGLYVNTEVAVYASVAGRVKFPTLSVRERAQGAQVPVVQDVLVYTASGSTPDVLVDHVWRVTASSADSTLVGREFRTKGLPQAGQTTAWRYPVEQVA